MKTVRAILCLALAAMMTLCLAASALAYTDGTLVAPKAKDVVIDGDLAKA